MGIVVSDMNSEYIRAYFLRASEGVVYKGYLSEITNSLKAKQEYVGGGIETFTLNDDLVLVGGRDAVVFGKTLNRALYDESGKFITAFAGNLLVVRYKGDEFDSILEEDVELVERLLKPIDRIACGTVFLKAIEELPEWKRASGESAD
nr:DUF3846 domain-containing protein [Acetivibrio ethanolgignens]